MYANTEQQQDEIAAVQKDWPAWRIWRASGGSWMATRRVTVEIYDVSESRGNTLMEDSRDDLVARLNAQEDNHRTDS
ncbi:hypothetical protein GCM10027589_13840 [Actinocorallia lasiicapitis]